MLPCQRVLFDMPRDICFFNAASWSPLPWAVLEAGRAAIARKGQPWRLAAENVHAAPRLGRRRIRPHVYNDEQDVDRFVDVFRRVASRGSVR